MNRQSASATFYLCMIAIFFSLAACSQDDAGNNDTAAEVGAAGEAETRKIARSESGKEPEIAARTSGEARKAVPTAGSAFDPVREYDQQCSGGDEDSLECEWLRGIVVFDIVEALEAIAESRDQRGVEEALAALDIDDEPELFIAACRVLSQFPDTPGIADKLIPLLLESPYFQVQEFAARVLGGNSDPSISNMANQWSRNHNTLYLEDPYDEVPLLPEHFAGMGFPEYPGAMPFSPADSDRSVGWATSDPLPDVVSWLGEALGTEALDPQQWAERSQQEMMAVMQSVDQTKVAEAERLTAEFMKTQDMALLEKVQRLQEEIYAPTQQYSRSLETKPDQVATPPYSIPADQAFFLIAEDKQGRVSRLILVYRQAVLERTVMQMAWDLADYPPAWSETP